jgi:hypothetical protein
LQESEQRGVGRLGGPHGVIGQNEFLQGFAEECAFRLNRD